MASSLGAPLRIDANTTLSHLQGFASQEAPGKNLRARKVDGGWEIFARPAKSGGLLRQALDTLKGPWQRHQVAQALRQVVDTHERLTGRSADHLLSHALTKPFGPDLTAGVLLVASIADDVRDIAPDTSVVEIFTPAPGPERFNMTEATVMKAAIKTAAALKAGADPATLVRELGDALIAGFEASHPGAQERKDFGTSNPEAARRELVALLTDLVGGAPPSREFSNVVFKLVSDVFNHAAAGTQADHFIDDDTFVFDGQTYVCDKPEPIGSGGFGLVREFRRVEDGVSFAIKVGLPPTPGPNRTPVDIANAGWNHLNNALHEIDLHGRVEGDGHPNVTHMVGGVRHPAGGMAIILELAPHGTMKGFGTKIENAVAAGAITRDEALLAKRSATRDMLHGIGHSHGNGMLNQDIKDDNFLITADGTVKLADNGGAREIKDYDNTNMGSFTPDYISPDAAGAPAANVRIGKAVGLRQDYDPIKANTIVIVNAAPPPPGEAVTDPPEPVRAPVGPPVEIRSKRADNPMRTAVREQIARLFPGLDPAAQESLLETVLKNAVRDSLDRGTDPVKRDVYAAGLAARSLLYRRGEDGGLVDSMLRDAAAERPTPAMAMANPVVALSDADLAAGRAIIAKVANWSKTAAAAPIVPPLFQTSVRMPQGSAVPGGSSAAPRTPASLSPSAPFMPPAVPIFSTATDAVPLPMPDDDASAPPEAETRSLRPELGTFRQAVVSGDRVRIAAAAQALDEGIAEVKGPSPRPPGEI